MIRLGLLSAAAAVPLALAAPFVIPLLYGPAFLPAVPAAQLLCVGLVGEGLGGVVTAFLYGTGRPGLNSMATAAGLATTVCLDLLLIPRHGLLGAAIASCAAYAVTTVALLACFRLVTRPAPSPAPAEVGRT
jgi:O-antigen/teichoic acid export membrane protein